MNITFNKDKRPAKEILEYAQWIAFGPIVFQVARTMWKTGILQTVVDSSKKGITIGEAAEKTGISYYGVRVLMEAALGMGIVSREDGKYTATKVAYILVNDRLTQINMDFTHDVNYQGAYYMEDAIRTGKPAGLKVFGEWNTVYEGLSQLPDVVKKSWLAFDHFYSDDAFPEVFHSIFQFNPKKILDIGGNTGKISMKFAEFNPGVAVTMVDLPGQIAMAKENIRQHGFTDRIGFYAMNILEPESELPKGFDTIWMSQFLDCFSDEQISSILKKCHKALAEGGHVFIMEPLWDLQRYDASAFVLQQTSLYFTTIANGNSQMYDSEVFFELIDKAGFKLEEVTKDIGVCQILLRLTKK